MKYHEDFEKTKGSFTPVVTDPITERVKKNMQDFSDISYRGIQRRVVEMERKRVDQDQENLTGKQNVTDFVTTLLLHVHKSPGRVVVFTLSHINSNLSALGDDVFIKTLFENILFTVAGNHAVCLSILPNFIIECSIHISCIFNFISLHTRETP